MPNWKVITDYIGYGFLFLGVGFIALATPLLIIVGEYVQYGRPYYIAPSLAFAILLMGSVLFYVCAWLPFSIYRESRKVELGDGSRTDE